MTLFRCPKCKHGIASTKYIKIRSASCKPCRMKMVKLYKPTVNILDLEYILNVSLQKE